MLQAELLSWKYSEFTSRLREHNFAHTDNVAHTAELYYTNIRIAMNFRNEHIIGLSEWLYEDLKRMYQKWIVLSPASILHHIGVCERRNTYVVL